MTGIQTPRATKADEAHLAYVASRPVAMQIAEMGRTEDVRFSPSNRRLAVAGYRKDSCTLFDIEIDRSAARPRINIHDAITLRSSALSEPHGFDFIDETTLVVANRTGLVVVLPIPGGASAGRTIDVTPISVIRWASRKQRIHSPGSVCVGQRGRLTVELLVCNNYRNLVSRHLLATKGWRGPIWNRVFLRDGLDIPDGIALSRDGSRLAVSNHSSHEVFIYDRNSPLTRQTKPHGILSGVEYPHGLRFSPNSTRLWVADAGAPVVVLYEDLSGGWKGGRAPTATITVLDDALFLKGRDNPQEGGPKGLDLDTTGEIVVITNEQQPLAFFHAPTLVG
jgi:hypothetical protein